MEAKAIRERWAVTPEQRQRAVDRLMEILDDQMADQRTLVAAARAMVAVDAQTLAWLLFEFKKSQAEGGAETKDSQTAALLRELLGKQDAG